MCLIQSVREYSYKWKSICINAAAIFLDLVVVTLTGRRVQLSLPARPMTSTPEMDTQSNPGKMKGKPTTRKETSLRSRKP